MMLANSSPPLFLDAPRLPDWNLIYGRKLEEWFWVRSESSKIEGRSTSLRLSSDAYSRRSAAALVSCLTLVAYFAIHSCLPFADIQRLYARFAVSKKMTYRRPTQSSPSDPVAFYNSSEPASASPLIPRRVIDGTKDHST
ncbi:hypothetical protein BDZ45DRAFT_753237 [Acephala macrosclerotiorum]|nr:hypothetical protein BDZ45DRAFT_753237 [Acephala macrosclerotiorum]